MNRTEISIFSILEFSVSLDGMYLLALGQVEERCSETMLLSLDMEFFSIIIVPLKGCGCCLSRLDIHTHSVDRIFAYTNSIYFIWRCLYWNAYRVVGWLVE